MKTEEISQVDHFLQFEKCAPRNMAQIVERVSKSLREYSEVRTNRELAPYIATPITMQLIFGLSDFVRAGRKTYVVGPVAQQMLTRTNLNNVPKEMVRIPMPAFYVALPQCEWEIWGGSRTGWHRVGGVYVSMLTKQESWDLQETSYKELNRRPLGYYEKPLTEEDDPDDLSILRMLVWGMPNEKSSDFMDDSLSYFSLFLNHIPQKYSNMEEMCLNRANMTVTGKEGTSTDLEVISKDPEVVWKHSRSIVNAFRVVLNLLLYLSSEDAEVRVIPPERKKLNSKNPKKLRREMRKSSSTIYIVGESLEKHGPRSSSGGDGASPRRHWVVGHWHTYWYGSRSGERTNKLRWVKPFLRGEGELEGSTTRVEVRDGDQ